MSLRVLGDFFQDGLQFHGGTPAPHGFRQLRVHDEPGNVKRAGLRISCDGVRAKTRLTPPAQLRKRHGVSGTTTEVHYTRFVRILGRELSFQKWQEVPGMNAIAALMPRAIKADTLQRLPPKIGVNPKRKNAL